MREVDIITYPVLSQQQATKTLLTSEGWDNFSHNDILRLSFPGVLMMRLCALCREHIKHQS